MNKSEISVEDLHARILSFTEKAKIAVTSTQFKVEYNIDKNSSFSSLIGMNVFRVIQEAINNAIKYAEAKNITIQLSKVATNFTATIIDDGIGFENDKIDFGNGLSNMKKRMNSVNGFLEIDSKKKKGTKIILKVSLKNTANDV
ncbi:sensor histidine kinase [Polaribacter ponticola]|uniref:histidine kinase n=1 Tax=Polaribacter ponticola TaxID=2978475 RepID=A0ABT5SCI8_9FLAO|nr:ATP-binding protein [Polaribacter sp. MSW5]MDD7915839.1 ATP-binding protein [Polaribacter sp. MSW5]